MCNMLMLKGFLHSGSVAARLRSGTVVRGVALFSRQGTWWALSWDAGLCEHGVVPERFAHPLLVLMMGLQMLVQVSLIRQGGWGWEATEPLLGFGNAMIPSPDPQQMRDIAL